MLYENYHRFPRLDGDSYCDKLLAINLEGSRRNFPRFNKNKINIVTECL